jgi:hypothetical protein
VLGNGLRQPSVDEAKRAEEQGGPRGQRGPAAVHLIR